jgi:hypothetical protein
MALPLHKAKTVQKQVDLLLTTTNQGVYCFCPLTRGPKVPQFKAILQLSLKKRYSTGRPFDTLESHPPLYSQADYTYCNHKELGSTTPPSSSSPSVKSL